MPKRIGRIKGTLRCPDGAVVPITSRRVVDALTERDREIAELRAQLSSRQERVGQQATELRAASEQLSAVAAALASLRSARWVRLGKWLRVIR